MTISSTTRIAGPFLSGTALPFTFKVFAAADLEVVRLNTSTGVETSLVLGSDYTVALNGNQNTNPGGTVNLTVAASATSTVTITSDIANLQPTDLTNQGGFYPEVITDALDRATIQIQQMSEDVGRSLKGPISDGNLNMELPTAAQRANSFLAFDANGVPTAVVSGSSGAPTTITRQVFSGTGSQTVFTLASDPGALGNSAQVYIGGVYQQRSTYTIAGTTLTFSQAPVAGTNNIEFVNFLTSNIGATSADLVTYTPAGSGAVARSAASKFKDTISVKDFGASSTATPAVNAAAITAAINYALTVNGSQQPHPAIEFPELCNITGYTITINKPTIIGYPDPYYLTFVGTGGGIRKDDAGYMFTGANPVSGFIRVQNMSFKSVRGAGTTVWDCNKLMYIDSSFNEYFAVDRVVYQDSDVLGELFQSSRFVNEHIKDGSGYAFLWKRAADIVIANCKFETRDSAIGNVSPLSPLSSTTNQNNTVRIENNVIQGLFLGDGAAIKLGNSWGLVIRGNYTESCKRYIDLHSLVEFAHTALTVEDNSFYLSAAQKLTKSGTYNQPGTTTITVTSAAHGLNNGDGVYLNFTSGTAADGSFVVSNVTTNTFDVISATALTTSGNVSGYYSPLIVGNLRTVLTATLRSHTNSFGRNVSDHELFCFVGTGTLNSYGDYAFSQFGFNNKNINVSAGRNTFTTAVGTGITTSGISKVFSFVHTETNLLAAEVRSVAISISDSDITNPVLLQNIYQVYPAQIASVNVLGIYPVYTTGNSGTLNVVIENRTGSTVATVVLNVVCMQLAGY